MSLASGVRLGPYEILEPAGAGGMGDVFRARDVRLERQVAVKTIRGPFTERFEREARAISALNHPNICTLFDVGQYDGSGYLVMEYIDGKPIAGPMPVEQAIPYAIQICEALHAAHKKGIVHRDLKPANILLTKQGVKLLDFGLAKLGASQPGGSSSGSMPSIEQATVAALTGAHTVVGTPQYMAPEQIEAKDVDARTDIFAFGCVLYELLTGQRAFDGKSASGVMAAVLATTPRPLSEIAPLTPPALERIVSRCLAKDPEDRWQTARDVSAELQWVSQGGSRVGLPAIVTSKRRVREGLAWAAFAVAALAAAGFAIAWIKRAPEPPAMVRFALQTPEGLSNPTTPEVSPDGRNVVFAAVDKEGKWQIWIRPLDSLDPRPIAEADNASRPFWAPDSHAIAFMVAGKLKKVDVAGGPPQTICDAPTGSDGSWSPNGVILFDGRGSDPIRRVSAAGGVSKPEVTTDVKKGTGAPGWPIFLPDGEHFLYTLDSGQGQTVVVGRLDSPDVTRLVKTGSRVLYAEPGYLLYVSENTLVAQRFNAKSLALEGDAVPIGEGLGVDSVGLASFSVSKNGVLAYRAGELQGRRLVWFDRNGKETPAIDEAGDYRDTWLSPDGKRVAFDASGPSTAGDIWIRDLVRGVTTRFTFDPVIERNPVWSPDGRQIVFTSVVKGPGDLYLKDASGTKEAELLFASPDVKLVSDWSRDGSYLLFSTQNAETGWDSYALPMKGTNRTPIALLKTKFDELFPTFSPDGHYIVYSSNESGRSEVYAQEFPDARTKSQISTDGGGQPYWSGDGKEIFYRSRTRLMAVPVQTSGALSIGAPTELFQVPFAAVIVRGHYRPAPDGKRFLVIAALGRDAVKPASVILNWTAALPK